MRVVHQGDIDTSHVGRVRHHVLISRLSKEGATGKVTHDTVVLDFTKSHHVGQLPSPGRVLAQGDKLP